MKTPEIAEAIAAIGRGGVVVYPTDTFYGLAVDPRNATAVERLFQLKRRDADKGTPLIAGSIAQAEGCVLFDDRAAHLARLFWPGPLSLVLPARTEILPAVLGGGITAAIRVPDNQTACAMALAAGYCLTATSANLSGQPPVTRVRDVDPELLAGVDFVLDAGETPGGAPSTIVDLTGKGPRLVRAGLIAWERVLESLE